MDAARIEALHETYSNGLLHDVVPFWLKNAPDKTNGGFYSCLDRDGTVMDTDKSVWVQGRFVWLLSSLCREIEPRDEWLDAAASGVRFIRAHCFDDDGRMFFQTTEDGRPLRKRRYLFSECFGVAGLAAFGAVTDDTKAIEEAFGLFGLIVDYYTGSGRLQPKIVPDTRRSRSIAMPMMLLSIAQILRDARPDPICDEWIDRAIEEIRRYHVQREPYRVLEVVGDDGEFQDHLEGRRVTPGHVIEAGWFILDESRRRGGDAALTEFACEIIDWAWRFGWDEQYGGLLYYKDVSGFPGTEYWHDMKFWWPHNEAVIATLLAYHMTGNERYADWHDRVHAWTYKHFPDPELGEWFGYLHRDGSLSTPVKGTMWKGPFHIPRMQLYCRVVLEDMAAGTGAISSGTVGTDRVGGGADRSGAGSDPRTTG